MSDSRVPLTAEAAPGEPLKLYEALALFSSQTAAVFQLWAFYTATVLGSLVFGMSHRETPLAAAIFLFGFWAFALGELTLLVKTMAMIDALAGYIAARFGATATTGPVAAIVARARLNAYPPGIAIGVQLLGDLCVTALFALSALGWLPVGTEPGTARG